MRRVGRGLPRMRCGPNDRALGVASTVFRADPALIDREIRASTQRRGAEEANRGLHA